MNVMLSCDYPWLVSVKIRDFIEEKFQPQAPKAQSTKHYKVNGDDFWMMSHQSFQNIWAFFETPYYTLFVRPSVHVSVCRSCVPSKLSVTEAEDERHWNLSWASLVLKMSVTDLEDFTTFTNPTNPNKFTIHDKTYEHTTLTCAMRRPCLF